VKQLDNVIGRIGTMQENGLVFKVSIKERKNAYGNERYLVTPVSGYGQTWVNAARVRVLEVIE